MNIRETIKQATRETGEFDLLHYTNLVLKEACRLIKETPITCAYTTFDLEVAKSQRADCFKQVYNEIIKNLNEPT
jgi:hypothetical protein